MPPLLNYLLLFILSLVCSTLSAKAPQSLPDQSSAPSPFFWITKNSSAIPGPLCQNGLEEEDIIIENYSADPINKSWSIGTPFHRWQQLMKQLSDTYPHRRNGGRMSHFYGGVHDAIQAVFLSLPHEAKNPILSRPKNKHIHYQLARIATAETAQKVLLFYFPEGAQTIQSEYQNHLSYINSLSIDSCWVQWAAEVGKMVGLNVIERAQRDRTRNIIDTIFKDNADGRWYGNPSVKDYAKRQWLPFVLDHPAQFRCPPPPKSWSADMEELRRFNKENRYSDIAWKWKSIPVWDNWLDHLILKYQHDFEPLTAARIYACFHIARYEATLSAWEAKYHYMGIRPFQYDTSFQPLLVTTPNFPGYPAGHTTVAGALAEVIGYFFPSEAKQAKQLALECSESRFEGGVHFRTDNEVGLKQGKRVGQAVISHIKK